MYGPIDEPILRRRAPSPVKKHFIDLHSLVFSKKFLHAFISPTGSWYPLALMYQYWYTHYMPNGKKISVVFYKTPAGNEPVREWLRALPAEEKKTIGEDIKAVELAWPVGIPLVRKMDTDLWEGRTQLPHKISRVFFTVWKGFMILLHGIIKKSQKTPKDDIDLAKKRRNDVLKGGLEDEK